MTTKRDVRAHRWAACQPGRSVRLRKTQSRCQARAKRPEAPDLPSQFTTRKVTVRAKAGSRKPVPTNVAGGARRMQNKNKADTRTFIITTRR